MPTRKSKPNPKPKITAQSHDVGADLAAQYKIGYSVLEAAVNAGLIAGLHPYAFEPALAFWFMQWVKFARENSSEAGLWQNPPMERFNEIVERVITFSQSYCGELLPDDGGEKAYQELSSPHFQAAMIKSEANRQQQLASDIAIQCVCQLEWHHIHPRALELVYLVQWLKVASLAGDISPKCYLTVKRSIPHVIQAYDDIAYEAISG